MHLWWSITAATAHDAADAHTVIGMAMATTCEPAEPGRFGRWRTRGQVILDNAVLAVVTALSVLVPLLLPAGEPRANPGAGTLGFLVVAAVFLAVRSPRARVQLVLAGCTVVIVTGAVLAVPGVLATSNDLTNLWMPLAPLGPTYGAYLYQQDRCRAWLMIGVLTAVATRPWEASVPIAATGLLYLTVPMLFGFYLSARRALVASLTERAQRAERERELRAEQARAEERVRLAAELHDIVTHRLSLMVLHAGALKVSAADEPTRAAAEEVRATGAKALDELRDLLGVLRHPAARPDG